MKFLKLYSWKGVLINLGIIILVGIVLTILYFYTYLPFQTNHGETISVPDVKGVHISDLDQFLGSRNLRFEVTADSGFSADVPPLSVLKQVPQPNSKVKENRKIYVTLNAEKPPMVRMPSLEGSIKSAQLILKSYDLKLGNITYVPYQFLNYVLEQRLNGRTILEGEMLPKGSEIDLLVGDGLGQVSLESPDLIGLDAESAQFAIIGSGLKIGQIIYEKEGKSVIPLEAEDGTITYKEEKVAPGAIFKQSPTAGQMMRLGQLVDIWVYRPDSVNVNPTLLDDE